jgi:5-methylcytosine-specific restriction endonuclease McrA
VSSISRAVRERVRIAARNRCGYYHAPQELVLGPLEIDHVLPEGQGGTSNEDNLWLACSVCNSHKAAKLMALDSTTQTVVPLFNPRLNRWNEHFRWDGDGAHALGITPIGRATVVALHLNNHQSVEVRKAWNSYGCFPPPDDARTHE